MKKKVTEQVSFIQGIVENIKQDVFEQHGLQGCLYLENYDPNLELLSVVKRAGQIPLISNEDETVEVYNEIVTKKKDIIIPSLQVYTPDLKNFEYYNIYDKIFHSTRLKVSNPDYNDNIILFFRRLISDTRHDFSPYTFDDGYYNITGTGIVSYSQNYKNDTLKFNEPFYDNMPSPGWYPLGTFRDIARWGETLLFVTTLEYLNEQYHGQYKNNTTKYDYCNELYPLYKWYYWDISNKREDGNHKYWFGIDFIPDLNTSTDNPYRTWKVKYPSLKLFRNNNIVGQAYIHTVRDYYQNHSVTSLKPRRGLFTGTQANPSNIIPVAGEDLNQYINFVFYEQDIMQDPYFSENPDSKIYQSQSDMDTYAFAYHRCKMITTLELTNNEIYNKLIRGLTSTQHDGNMHTIPQQIIFRLKDGRIINGMGHQYEADWEDGVVEIYQSLIPLIFPNYVDEKLPRPWLYHDRIPYLLTMVIDGVEIILKRDTYVVGSQNNIIEPNSRYIGFPSLMAEYDAISPSFDGADKRYAKKVNLLNELSKDATDTTARMDFYLLPYQYRDNYNNCYYYYPDPWCILRYMLTITLEGRQLLIENNVQSIKLYVSTPNLEGKTLFKTIGTSLQEPNPGVYAFPTVTESMQIEENDIDNYALVKEYVFDGEGQTISDSFFDSYNGEPVKTNAWNMETGTHGMVIVSKGLVNDGTYTVKEQQWINPMFNCNRWLESSWYGASGHNFTKETYWNPDNILWDYPIVSKPLNLNSSGKYWEGMGAGLICVVKGRPFIGKTIDKDGNEEQALLRMAAIQNGVISSDLFNDEDFFKVGHLPFTALIEYREELIIFNRETYYRLQLPEIANPLTWEFVEVTHEHGAFNQKCVCNTPHGICYANESGIWITTGGLPESLTNNLAKNLSVNSIYKTLSTNKPYLFLDNNYIGIPRIDPFLKYNAYMELMYDSENNELVFIAPVNQSIDDSQFLYTENDIDWIEYCKNNNINYEETTDNKLKILLINDNDDIVPLTHEIRLIFNFSNQNWRVEKYSLAFDYPAVTVYSRTTNKYHRQHFNKQGIITTRLYPQYGTTENNQYVDFAKPEYNLFKDYFWDDNGKYYQSNDILGTIITHDIGDGIKDYLLYSALIECTPRDSMEIMYNNVTYTYEGWNNYVYNINNGDPKLIYEPRARTYRKQNTNFENNETSMDMIRRNMIAKGGINPFNNRMQTPSEDVYSYYINDYTKSNPTIVDKMTGRESLTILSPIQTKFRRKRFKFVSDVVVKIRSLMFNMTEYGRRNI